MKICKNYVNDRRCERDNCRFCSNNNNRNTELFKPDFSEPDMRIVFNQPINDANQVTIIHNCHFNTNTIQVLLDEINNDVYKLCHGNNYLIADNSLKWKENSPTFNHIIDTLCKYFNMTASTTQLNYYKTGEDWTPYHHDAAVLNPEKAKFRNITVGLSFGLTREISFQHTKKRTTINFPLEDGVIYAFGNKINSDFRHGIPTIERKRI